jgi:orotidine-5'-phosphate decarboxylase
MIKNSKNHSPIICAFDETDVNKVINQLKQIEGSLAFAKLGLEFFCANGVHGVKKIQQAFPNLKIFLDLKLHDIPTTVAKALSALLPLKIDLLTVHLSGGRDMLIAINKVIQQAKQNNIPTPKILGVSLLTSQNEADLKETANTKFSLKEYIANLVNLALEEGLDGVIASPFEASEIRRLADKHKKPNFLIITPGIRLENDANNDQKRTATPIQAIKNGADYLVIGRTITSANDMPAKVKEILDSIK